MDKDYNLMEEKEVKLEKTGKAQGATPVAAPLALKKPIKKSVFEKRLVKYLEYSSDRDFFVSRFELREDKYFIHDSLTKDESIKLKQLLKAIKENRKGPIKVVPLAFAGIVIAALVVFFTMFANPLLENALEKGLEAIFEAKSDVDHLRLSLVPLRIAIGGVTVANRDSPMKNLFQMGKTVISLKTEAVLRGKIYINEIRSDTIRFGTARSVSGALPAKPPKQKKEKPKSDAPPLVDLKNFDAMALLNREYDKLKTPKLYDEAINAYNETYAKWQGQVALAQTRAGDLQNAAKPLLNLNVNNYRSIDAETIKNINKTIQDINTMVTTVQTAVDDATKMVSGIDDDIKSVQKLEQNARTSIADDFNHLKSYINLESGAAFSALEPSIREVLSDTAEQYFDYGMRGLEMLEKLKAQQAAKPKKEKPLKEPKVVFKGRNVAFPSRQYPQFYLGVLASDFTLDTWNWAFDLRDVSSNPDLTGKPVVLKLGLTEDGGNLKRNVSFNGAADFRTKTTERFSARVDGEGFPVELAGSLNQVGINGFKGNAAFSVNMTGRVDGGVSGGGDVRISQPQLLDPSGTLAEAIDAAVREAGLVDLGIQYNHRLNQTDEFTIQTNIASLMVQALKRTAEAYAKKAMDEIEKALRAKIDQYIDGRFASKEDLDALFKVARGDKDAMDQLKNTLNTKKTEFEQKAKAAADQAVQQVTEEAKKQAEQAAQDVMQGKTPALQTPSLPNLPGGIPGLPKR